MDGFRAIVPVAVIDRPSDVLRAERPPFVGTDDRAYRMDGRVREGVGEPPGAVAAEVTNAQGRARPRAAGTRTLFEEPHATSAIVDCCFVDRSVCPPDDGHPHAPAHRPGRTTKKAVSWSRCFRAGHPESGTGPSAYGRQPRGAVFAAGRPDGYVRHVPDGRLLENCDAASTIESRRHRATGVAFVPLRCEVIGVEDVERAVTNRGHPRRSARRCRAKAVSPSWRWSTE